MILRDNTIKFEEFDYMDYLMGKISGTFNAICILKIPENKIIFPEDQRDFDYNTELNFTLSFSG